MCVCVCVRVRHTKRRKSIIPRKKYEWEANTRIIGGFTSHTQCDNNIRVAHKYSSIWGSLSGGNAFDLNEKIIQRKQLETQKRFSFSRQMNFDWRVGEEKKKKYITKKQNMRNTNYVFIFHLILFLEIAIFYHMAQKL